MAKVIRHIAEQTNLLAFNARSEAAQELSRQAESLGGAVGKFPAEVRAMQRFAPASAL